jgi:hypothetical protein
MTPEQTNLLLAAAAAVLTMVAVIIASNTLTYMRRRDLELDTRNGWIEIHKAMINLRVQREFVMLRDKLPHYNADAVHDEVKDYTLASAQLRGQLDRLNDDELLVKISEFLNANQWTQQWQRPEFLPPYDTFVHEVALKARPE